MTSSADLEPRLRSRSGDIGVSSSSTGSLLMAAAAIVRLGLEAATGEMGFSREVMAVEWSDSQALEADRPPSGMWRTSGAKPGSGARRRLSDCSGDYGSFSRAMKCRPEVKFCEAIQLNGRLVDEWKSALSPQSTPR